jgi:hypothetical protein
MSMMGWLFGRKPADVDQLLDGALDRMFANDRAGAARLASEAVAAAPRSCKALVTRSLIRYHFGDVMESLSDYWEAKEIEPETLDIAILLEALGLLYKEFTIVIANSRVGDGVRMPTDPVTRGATALLGRRLDEAEALFRTALHDGGRSPHAWVGLVLARYWSRDFAEALRLCSTCPDPTPGLRRIKAGLERGAGARV